MGNNIQKDWLKIDRMVRDITWLTYDSYYDSYPSLKKALKELKIARDELKKVIEGTNEKTS